MVREIGWEDEEAAKRDYGDVDRYRAEENKRDKIRILTTCWAYVTHWLYDRGKKGFYNNCGLDSDGNGKCLFCEATEEKDGKTVPKYKREEKYACVVLHIAEKKAGGDWTELQKVKVWYLGKDKYADIKGLKEDFGDVRKIDLLVTCKDEQFQDLTLTPTGKPSEASKEAVKAHFKDMQERMMKDLDPTPLEEQEKSLGLRESDDFPHGENETGDEAGAAAAEAEAAAGGDVSDEVDNLLDDL